MGSSITVHKAAHRAIVQASDSQKTLAALVQAKNEPRLSFLASPGPEKCPNGAGNVNLNGISCRLSLVCALCPCTLCFVIGFSRACLVLKVRFGKFLMANFGGTSQGELSVANPILMLRQSYDCRVRQFRVFSLQENVEYLCVHRYTSNTYRFACLIGPFSLLTSMGSLSQRILAEHLFSAIIFFITKYIKLRRIISSQLKTSLQSITLTSSLHSIWISSFQIDWISLPS